MSFCMLYYVVSNIVVNTIFPTEWGGGYNSDLMPFELLL